MTLYFKYVPNDGPARNKNEHGHHHLFSFQYTLPSLFPFTGEEQVLNAEEYHVGYEDDQDVVILDGLEKPAVQESMDKPLHPAT